MSGQPIVLVTTRSDADRAREIREKLEKALEPVCRVMDEAVKGGFTINFNLMPDYRQMHVIGLLKVMKEF